MSLKHRGRGRVGSIGSIGSIIRGAGARTHWSLKEGFHCEDGPAISYSCGAKFWYLNGEKITLETKSKDPKVLKLQELMKVQEVLES